jgi:hypothetical protein
LLGTNIALTSYQHKLRPEDDELMARLMRWDSRVVIQLALQELMQPLTYHEEQDSLGMKIKVGKDDALTIQCPPIKHFIDELDTVLDWAQLRRDRGPEILAQVSNTGAFWRSILPLSPAKQPMTYLLLVVANRLSSMVVQRLKHAFAVPRPNEMTAQVQPMIRTPRHGAYPMGHFCEAVMTASLLSQLTSRTGGSAVWKAMSTQLWRLAIRIGQNRVVAGVHYPTDMSAGLATGLWLADYVLASGEFEITKPVTLPKRILTADTAKTWRTLTDADHLVDVSSRSVLLSDGEKKYQTQPQQFTRVLCLAAAAEWDWLDLQQRNDGVVRG